MNAQRLGRKLQEFAEWDIPSASVNLWPAIHAQVAAKHLAEERQHVPRRRFRLAASVALLVLAAGVLLGTPAIRATHEAIEHRFGLALSNAGRTEPTTERVEGEGSGPATRVPASATAVQGQMPFPVRTPGWLPPGLTLAQTFVTNEPVQTRGSRQQIAQVNLFYRPTAQAREGNAPQVAVRVTDHPEVAPTLLPRSRAQAISANGHPATYVHGGWRGDGHGDPLERRGDLRWDDELDSAWLSWEEGGLTYTVSAHGLGLSQEDLLRIAESLR